MSASQSAAILHKRERARKYAFVDIVVRAKARCLWRLETFTQMVFSHVDASIFTNIYKSVTYDFDQVYCQNQHFMNCRYTIDFLDARKRSRIRRIYRMNKYRPIRLTRTVNRFNGAIYMTKI